MGTILTCHKEKKGTPLAKRKEIQRDKVVFTSPDKEEDT